MDAFEEGLLIGLLLAEGHFGGDGKQPHITIRRHVLHEPLLRWLATRVPGSRLYGPYRHGGRNYFQWMARGSALTDFLIPLLDRYDWRQMDPETYRQYARMKERYGIKVREVEMPMGSPPPFEVMDHTADVGIIAYGRDLAELLENATAGMISLMVDVTMVAEKEKREIVAEIPFPAPEMLLLKWLKEVHSLFEIEKFVTRSVRISQITDETAKGEAYGETFNPNIALLHHIKAVTHHLVSIEKTDHHLKAQVIFDV